MKPADRYPAVLLLVFGAIWAALAIAPSYRQDWLLENVLTFVAVPLLVATARTLRFSNVAVIETRDDVFAAIASALAVRL
mgnify:CR=1 FL=1